MIVTCVDVGSTFTKAIAVEEGRLVGRASHRTTIESDVLIGLDAAVAGTGVTPDEVLVCSSAGGGLRLAVIGYERLVTAQAGYRAGLSAGAKVVHVAAGKLGREELAALREARPDVVLLVGGTDGGDEETIAHNATRLAKARWRVPVVLAGNAAVADQLGELLGVHGVPVTVAGNVLPQIGVLDPGPARRAIRAVFLSHVIGGKKLSRGNRFASLVRGATPDVVLTGVELLAAQMPGDLLVVDVGGATTDVYSVLNPTQEIGEAEVAGVLAAARTVEGDLGMRWSAPGVIAAAVTERLMTGSPTTATAGLNSGRTAGNGQAGSGEELVWVAQMLAAHPELASHEADEMIAGLAVAVALRRHARGESLEPGGPRRGGRDLRAVQLVVGSGGVLRHNPAGVAQRILSAGLHDEAGGWPLPRAPRVAVDSEYVLAAAGLLADTHPESANILLRGRLLDDGAR
jgi:uncharacterized protein (TIGR01319 family)